MYSFLLKSIILKKCGCGSLQTRYLQFGWKMCMVKSKSLNDFLVYILIGAIFFQTSGPLLPIPLKDHSMVKLGKGQAILGGISNGEKQAKIYSMTCSNRNCIILLLDRELSVPKGMFVAISISDKITGCITKGKNDFQKTSKTLTPHS